MKHHSLKVFSSFNLLPFILSLLASNFMKSVGIAIDFHWVDHGGVTTSKTCTGQAVILQLSNLGIAIWTPIIGLALLNIAYLRIRLNRTSSYAILILGWLFAIFLVILGPVAVETKKRGPFFGVSGPWCGITDKYPMEHIFLEYFFLLLSALVCMAIVMALRMHKAKQSSLSHLVENPEQMDDETMRRMTWIPILYIVTVLMFTISRMVEAGGVKISFGFVAFTTILFNLSGLFNVIAILYIARHQSLSTTYQCPASLSQFMTKKPTQKFSLGSLNSNPKANNMTTRTFHIDINNANSASKEDESDAEEIKGNVFIAPDSWKTSAPKGRRY